MKTLNKVIKEAKVRCHKECVKNLGDDARQLWTFIKSKIGNKQSRDSIEITYINEHNQKIDNQPDVANSNNAYFSSVEQVE